MRFEKIKIWEGVSQSYESDNERLLLKNLGERVIFNNLLEYLDTAKIRSSEFGCLTAKMGKKTFSFLQI